MTSGPPPLDTRDLAALLAQLQEWGRQSLPAWTPPPEGDAGTALYRIFARYVEIAMQRLGGVPDKVLLTFLDTMGVSLLPPAPARVPLVFSLVPGAGPTLLPAGTQAVAPATGTAPEVTFETEQDLLVLPTRLAAAHTVDPVWDRFSDLSESVTVPPEGSTAPLRHRSVFVGDSPAPHVLHVGQDGILDVGTDVVIALGLTYRSSAPPDAVEAFLRSLVLSYSGGGTVRTLSPTVVLWTADGAEHVSFQTTVPPVDVQTLDGVGLPAPLTSRWLRLVLPAPFPDAGVPADLTVRPELLDVEAGGLTPDTLLAGTAPLDPSRDFLPFGDHPQVGDALFIRSDQAFHQPVAVTLAFASSAGVAASGLSLTWECLTATGWSAVTSANPSSTDAGTLTAAGRVDLVLPPLPLRDVAGRTGRWIRVRIASGGYGSPAVYEPVAPADPARGYRLRAGTGTLAPPRLSSLQLFYNARTVPWCVVQAGELYLPSSAEDVAPFPSSDGLPAPYADPDPAFYVGFDDLAPQQALTLYVDVPAPAFTRPGPAAPASTTEPALRWEYFDGSAWAPLTVFDGTRGFTTSGTISLITPTDLAPVTRFAPPARAWLRVRSATNDPVGSPRVTAVHVNAVQAIGAVTVTDEVLGSSNGQPGQVFTTAGRPVQPGQRLLVAEPQPLSQDEADALAAEEGPDAVVSRPDRNGGSQTRVRWHEVPNLVTSGPTSRHYTLDHATGTLTFGDGLHGLIPPRGAAALSLTYRQGGGSAGNLPAGAVTQLGSPLPAVKAVTNPAAADGGADLEPLDAVRERGAHALRHRGRAVSAADVEWLARQAAGTRVARAVCLSHLDRSFSVDPGSLTVLVIPAGQEATPRPTPQLVKEVSDHLAASSSASLAAGRITVIGPAYVRVTVDADVVPRVLADADLVSRRAVAALAAFFHPVSGGPAGDGWALGRAVHGSEVAQVLERVDGVSYVKTLALQANLVQRRLRLAGAPSPVAPTLLPIGSSARSADGQYAAQLAQAIPARTLADRVDVTGFREGDQVTLLVDLALLDGAGAGPLRARLVAGSLASGFPTGSVVLSGSGRTRLRRAVPARRGPAPSAPEVLLELDDPPPLAAGDVVTVWYPFPFTVQRVRAETAGDVTLTVTPAQSPIPPSGVLPAGAVVGTLDDRVRAPLAQDLAAGADGTVDTLVVRDALPGEQLLLTPPEPGHPVLRVVVKEVAPVTDQVHLDPYVFAYSAGHRIRISAM